MRVLHVIESMGRGGAEQLLTTLLPELRNHGICPLLGVVKPPVDLLDDIKANGIPSFTLPRFAKWNLLAGSNAVRQLCDAQSVDIVHAHLYFPGIYAGLSALKGGPPMTETFHNLAYAGANRSDWKLKARRRIRSAVLRRAGQKFYAVSHAVADHYRHALRLTQVEVLPNVVDLAAIAKVNPVRRNTNSVLRIVTPGRLVVEKGHIDLLDAVKDGPRPIELVFVGGGPLETHLRAYAKALDIPLRITGAVDHAQFLAETAAADLVVVPSRYEGFGIAAAEAMALGKPVVCTNAGGLPEVIGRAGIIVPRCDTRALRRGIDEMLSTPNLMAALGSEGRRRAKAKFSPQSTAAQLAAGYRLIAARTDRPVAQSSW